MNKLSRRKLILSSPGNASKDSMLTWVLSSTLLICDRSNIST